MSPSASHAFLVAASCMVPAASAAVLDLPIWFRNTYAVVEVNIGTPATSHLLRFDTGSATSWVVDQECANDCDNFSGYPRTGYNATASTTSGSLGTYGVIEYLGGNTEGPGVYDQFTGPPSELSWNQSFLAANLSSWAQTAADGFLGLAFSSISVAEAPTVVETLLWDGLLDEPRFGLYYGTEWENTGDAGDGPGDGVLTFGGSRESEYVASEEDLTWVPLVLLEGQSEYQVWRTGLVSFSAQAGNAANESKEIDLTNTFAVFDTGAGSISVPENQVDAMYEAIGMNYRDILENGYVPLCTEFNSSWSVSFNFRGEAEGDERTITLTGDQLARPGFAGGREDACWPPFEGGNGDGFFLIGTPLLHHFYTIWDFGAAAVEDYQPQIGFGKLKSEL